MSKLALGTVQFGLDYGLANTSGQVSIENIKEILRQAKDAGIDTLDTAIAYGSSEERLGEQGVDDWDIVTKLPPVPNDCADVKTWVNDEISASLARLHVNKISALMLHRPTQLMNSYGEQLWVAMKQLKENQIVKKIGFSIYDPFELDQLWDKYQPDIIQSPYNVLDQRLKSSGWLEKLNKNNVEVHIRSVFLQGLMLLSKQARPNKFNRWDELWTIWDQYLVDEQLSPVTACLASVTNEKKIDRIIVGVDSPTQLQEIIGATHAKIENTPNELCCMDEDLLNPAKWSQL